MMFAPEEAVMLKVIPLMVALLAAAPAWACDDAAHARELRELRAQTRALQDDARAARDLARIERDKLKLKLLDRQQRSQR
jgi:hypothetical protein